MELPSPLSTRSQTLEKLKSAERDLANFLLLQKSEPDAVRAQRKKSYIEESLPMRIRKYKMRLGMPLPENEDEADTECSPDVVSSVLPPSLAEPIWISPVRPPTSEQTPIQPKVAMPAIQPRIPSPLPAAVASPVAESAPESVSSPIPAKPAEIAITRFTSTTPVAPWPPANTTGVRLGSRRKIEREAMEAIQRINMVKQFGTRSLEVMDAFYGRTSVPTTSTPPVSTTRSPPSLPVIHAAETSEPLSACPPSISCPGTLIFTASPPLTEATPTKPSPPGATQAPSPSPSEKLEGIVLSWPELETSPKSVEGQDLFPEIVSTGPPTAGPRFMKDSFAEKATRAMLKDKTFPCGLCGGHFSSDQALGHHMFDVHPGPSDFNISNISKQKRGQSFRLLSCQGCDQKFATKSGLESHVARDSCRITKSLVFINKGRRRRPPPPTSSSSAPIQKSKDGWTTVQPRRNKTKDPQPVKNSSQRAGRPSAPPKNTSLTVDVKVEKSKRSQPMKNSPPRAGKPPTNTLPPSKNIPGLSPVKKTVKTEVPAPKPKAPVQKVKPTEPVIKTKTEKKNKTNVKKTSLLPSVPSTSTLAPVEIIVEPTTPPTASESHDISKLTCHLCERSFKSMKGLRCHMQDVHEIKPVRRRRVVPPSQASQGESVSIDTPPPSSSPSRLRPVLIDPPSPIETSQISPPVDVELLANDVLSVSDPGHCPDEKRQHAPSCVSSLPSPALH